MESEFAPIVIFTYKRLDTLKLTVEALSANSLAAESNLIIYSDGAKFSIDAAVIAEVRAYIKNISGFKSITIYESPTNKGLANSIIEGVTDVINQYGKVIILEDDIVVSENFLAYMNQALDYYKINKKIFSVSGYTIPVRASIDYKFDVYCFLRASSWGWATWIDRWQDIDWQVKDYSDFRKNKKANSEFDQGGKDLSGMLKRQMNGEINSWAIRWCYHQFKAKTLTVYPVISKVQNIGFNMEASNTNSYNRNYTTLDRELKTQFNMPSEVILEESFVKQFQYFYSVKSRIIGKLYTYMYRIGLIKNK